MADFSENLKAKLDIYNGSQIIDISMHMHNLKDTEFMNLVEFVRNCPKISSILPTQERMGNTIYFSSTSEWDEYIKNHKVKLPSAGPSAFGGQESHTRTNRQLLIKNNSEIIVANLSNKEVNSILDCIREFAHIANMEKYERYEHYKLSEEEWMHNAYQDLSDPITQDVFYDPQIASDGHTYSYSTLVKIIKEFNGISPMTREALAPIGKPNQQVPEMAYGIPNIAIRQLVEKFKEGKLKTSKGGSMNDIYHKYLKYKHKYINDMDKN